MPFRVPPNAKSLFPEDAESRSSRSEMVTAHVDGGARGNPGPSGFGVVLTGPDGKKIAELSEYLGHQTNNFAEYSGLIAALRYAVEHDIKALRVVSDSELMVKQIKGQYKVNSPALRELYRDAQRLISQLEYFKIDHVLREKNRDADRLANEAMDRGSKRASSSSSAPSQPHEVRGIVQGGVVEFLGEKFPDGEMVKVRRAKE